MRRWPDSLPTPSWPGFGLDPVDKTIRTPFQVGEARVRQLTFARQDRLTMSWIFTDAEMRVFRQWFDDLPASVAGDSDDLTAWTTGSASVSLSSVVGPDDCIPTRLTPAAELDTHFLTKAFTALAFDGLDIAATVSLAPAGYSKARLRWFDRASVGPYADVDLATGTLIGTPGFPITLTDRGRGFWRLSARVSTGTGGANPVLRVLALDDTGTLTWTPNGWDGLDVCEVMLRRFDRDGDDLFLRSGADNNALGTAGGSAWVWMPAPVGGGFDYLETRFIGAPSAKAGANLEWTVSAQVEVRYA